MNLSQAEKAINAVTLGLDMTLRNLQATLKKNGHPWTIAKVFPDAAILGPWIPYQDFLNYLESPFSLFINDKLKQQACGNQMMMKPAELLVYVSEYFPLCKGDVIFTGTPAGVGAVVPGDIAKLCWKNKWFKVKWE